MNAVADAERAERRVLARERDQRDLHEILPRQVVDRETHAVHRDRAVLQTLVGGLDGEREPGFSFAVPRFPRRLRDSAHGTYDPGKHSRLSNTNNVSEPRALRSTGVQRGAAARGCAGTPGKAGTAPSPSHTGACTQ